MAIASITSVTSHVSGVNSRVFNSPCPTTVALRTASPHLSVTLVRVWAAIVMCRDPPMAHVLNEAMVHLSVHLRCPPRMDVTLARLRRIAGWFAHLLPFGCRPLALILFFLYLTRFAPLLGYPLSIHLFLSDARSHFGACNRRCACVSSSCTRSSVTYNLAVPSQAQGVLCARCCRRTRGTLLSSARAFARLIAFATLRPAGCIALFSPPVWDFPPRGLEGWGRWGMSAGLLGRYGGRSLVPVSIVSSFAVFEYVRFVIGCLSTLVIVGHLMGSCSL
eukprot:2015675-Pyramimonas_sp.AAC.1